MNLGRVTNLELSEG